MVRSASYIYSVCQIVSRQIIARSVIAANCECTSRIRIRADENRDFGSIVTANIRRGVRIVSSGQLLRLTEHVSAPIFVNFDSYLCCSTPFWVDSCMS